jgi:hypothetical protein
MVWAEALGCAATVPQNRMGRRGRWAWPVPGGVAGLREVDGRYLRGSSQVNRGHEPCWQIAARMAQYVMRTPVARGVLAPASLFAGSGLPADSGRTERTRSCRTCPATISHTLAKDSRRTVRSGLPGWGSIRRMSGRGVPASASAGRRLSGVPGRVQDGSGAVRCSRTQLDLMGHDPEPAPR